MRYKDDFTRVVMIALSKKNKAMECSDFRTISFISMLQNSAKSFDKENRGKGTDFINEKLDLNS